MHLHKVHAIYNSTDTHTRTYTKSNTSTIT